ncbi:DnaJ domain protein [Aspergillus clavatus NRRL 1]|uniref:DnaJ domain protein n=1 Tax=Aspergillus clavatus (strain ATCC 1007 / CBS 513.65 / DSM 816 / NCTC 3887 / NRRL 1 / QM 1276 / 107) TaxID=344612 RepID=A1CRV6_ASPCL|nr:DnaJ domain protein [Aspergillus clavatus NRRL 1]EAW08377.1 DnaJ domain protein [Aspergillus clavatus NRRL 1]
MSRTTAVNYYEILGIRSDATIKDINTAYKRLALKYHPDKAGGVDTSQTEFQKIQQAVETLRDPFRRKTHDLELVRLGKISVQETTFPRAGGAEWSAYGFKRYDDGSRYMYSYENSVHVSPQNKESKEDMAWVEQMLKAEEEYRKNLAKQREQEQMRAQRATEEEEEEEEGGWNENDKQQQQQPWEHGHPGPFQQYTFTKNQFQAEEDEYDFYSPWEIPGGPHWKDRNIWDRCARRAPQWGQCEEEQEEEYYQDECQGAQEHEDIYGENAGDEHKRYAGDEYERGLYEDPNQIHKVEAEGGEEFYQNQEEGQHELYAEEDEDDQEIYENRNELYEGDDEDEQESYAEEGEDDSEPDEYQKGPSEAEADGEQTNNGDQAQEKYGAYEVDYEDEQEAYGDHAEEQHGFYETEADHYQDSYEEEAYYESEDGDQSIYEQEYSEHDHDFGDSSFLPDDQLSEYLPSVCESEGEYATAKSNDSEFQNCSDKGNIGAVPHDNNRHILKKAHNPEEDTGVYYDFSEANATHTSYNTNPPSTNDPNEIENNHETENRPRFPHNDFINESNLQHILAPFIPYFRGKLDDPSGRYTEEDLRVELRGIVMEIFCGWLENLRLAVPHAEIPATGNDPEQCPHLGAWVKRFDRPECKTCHRWKPIYTLTCPGCGIKACVSCRFQ